MTNEEQIRQKIAKLERNLPAAIALDAWKPIEIHLGGKWVERTTMDGPDTAEYRPKSGPTEIWLAVYSLDGMEWARGKYPSKQACEFRCAHVSNFARAVRYVGVRE